MASPEPMVPKSRSELLRESAWIRGRAHRMACDPHAADDLAQETLLAALTHPPRVTRDLRAWLAAVMRNVLRQRARAEERRRRRELVVARPPTVHAPAESEAVREALAETLARLEEPFRTALLLRYYEDCGIPEIARRTGVPVDTVRSRLRRGLARMRRRLVRELRGEDRRFLGALLAPLARPGGGPGAPSSFPAIGWMVMNVKWIAAAGVLVLAGVWLVPMLQDPSGAARVPGTARDEGVERGRELGAGGAGELEAPRVAEGERAAIQGPVPAEEAAVDAPPVTLRQAWVLGVDGAPLADVRVAFVDESGERTSFSSAPHGGVELELLPGQEGTLRCEDERFATVLEGDVRAGESADPTLVVAPAVDLAGVVVDTDGRPLEDAIVELEMPSGYQRRFVHVLDASVERQFGRRTDSGGSFAFAHVPAVEGARIAARKPGFAGAEQAAPVTSDGGLRIVLEPRSGSAGELLGRVLDREGLPVPGARVAGAGRVIRTGGNGDFVFTADVRAAAREIVAVQAGRLPARARALEGPGGPIWPDFVELRLGGPPLQIRGRVVDAAGEPIEGVRVWVDDPTHLGVEDDTPVQLEGLAAGASSRSEVELSGGSIKGRSTSFWCWDATDGEGRFRLDGLTARDYRVKAMDMENLLFVESEGVAAGAQGVELVLTGGHRVAGVVRSSAGGVVAEATVLALHRAYGVSYGEGMTTVWDVSGPETVTDGEGRFEFGRLPSDLWLYVSGEGVAGKAYFVQPEDDLEALAITVELVDTELAHFRVELSDPERADRFELLGPDGTATEVALIRAGSRISFHQPELVGGISYVYAVREGRYELVLYLRDAEVGREWVALKVGEVTTLGR